MPNKTSDSFIRVIKNLRINGASLGIKWIKVSSLNFAQPTNIILNQIGNPRLIESRVS